MQTDFLGGPWTDFGGGTYMGFHFFSNGNIYIIISNDGVNWNEGDSGVDLKKAENGDWESDAGGWGIYTFLGNDMTWVNNATASTSFYEKL